MSRTAIRLIIAVTVLTLFIIERVMRARSKRRREAFDQRMIRDLVGRARGLDATPAGKVVEGDVVRVIGEVRALETVPSPLDKKPCVSWHVVVSVFLDAGDGSRWEILSDESGGSPFVLADATGEIRVDPHLATVGLSDTRAKTYPAGRALPSVLAAYCVAQGMSLDDLRNKSIYVVENAVRPGARVAVVGLGKRVERHATGERDYRSSAPSWVSLDASSVELLISDDRALMRAKKSRSKPVDWPGVRSAGETAGMRVEDFEAQIAAQSRNRRRIMVGVPLAIVLAIGGAVGYQQLTKEAPDVLTEAQRTELEGAVDRHRIAAYRSDDGWRTAHAYRRELEGSGPCPIATTRVPYVRIERDDDLPLQSPRTTIALAMLELTQRMLVDDARGSTFAFVKQQLDQLSFPARDILVETSTTTARAWLYDHAAKRILCASSVADPSGAGLVPLAIESLQGVDPAALP